MKDIISYLIPQSSEWYGLKYDTDLSEEEKKRIETNEKRLKDLLLKSLQMQNLMILTGCGTSLSLKGSKAPSMNDLWESIEELHTDTRGLLKRSKIAESIKYNGDNIEEFLTQCEAFLQIYQNLDVEAFYYKSKEIILKKCSFEVSEDDLSAHKTFLYKLARRRTRDTRLKLFTTNYDLCFEKAASYLGLIVIDGFSFTLPRRYDPRYFNYDIVRRLHSEEMNNYVEGVFHLYKLHGSVNWAKDKDNGIIIKDNPGSEEACIIYPAKGKYQQSYNQPYFECMSRYMSSLRESNTCIIVIGFGFNDEHLVKPLLSAVTTNPHLRLIVVDINIHKYLIDQNTPEHWKYMRELSSRGYDIYFINSTFEDFVDVIPDLKTLTPAEQLYQNMRSILGEQK